MKPRCQGELLDFQGPELLQCLAVLQVQLVHFRFALVDDFVGSEQIMHVSEVRLRLMGCR